MSPSTVIVTPVNNEQEFLPSFSNTSLPVAALIESALVIDNESTDSSPDIIKLGQINSQIISFTSIFPPSQRLRIGREYHQSSTLAGSSKCRVDPEFIGILDLIVEFKKLFRINVGAFDADPALGVTSGIPIVRGKTAPMENALWPLWKSSAVRSTCLRERDTLSAHQPTLCLWHWQI